MRVNNLQLCSKIKPMPTHRRIGRQENALPKVQNVRFMGNSRGQTVPMQLGTVMPSRKPQLIRGVGTDIHNGQDPGEKWSYK